MLWAKPTYFEIPSWAPLHTDLSCQNRGWDKDVVQRSAGRGSREPIEVQMQKKKKRTRYPISKPSHKQLFQEADSHFHLKLLVGITSSRSSPRLHSAA